MLALGRVHIPSDFNPKKNAWENLHSVVLCFGGEVPHLWHLFQQDLGQTWQPSLLGCIEPSLKAQWITCCIMIVTSYFLGQTSQYTLESGEWINPKFGLSPFASVIVTTRKSTCLHKNLSLHLQLITGKGNSPIPSIILLFGGSPPKSAATYPTHHRVLDWLFICAATGAIGGQWCLYTTQQQKQQQQQLPTFWNATSSINRLLT